MLTKHRRNKENQEPFPSKYPIEQQYHKQRSVLKRSNNVGKIVKNRSICGTKSTNNSNQNSRVVLHERPACTNYTRPSSRNKERETFLEKFNQMKCRYEMIDEYLYQKISKLESVQSSRSVKVNTKREKEIGKESEAKSRVESRVCQRTMQSSKKETNPSRLKQSHYQNKPSDYSKIIKQFKNQLTLQTTLRTLKHRLNQKNNQQIKVILSTKYKLKQPQYALTVEEFDPFLVQTTQCDPEELAKQIKESVDECENNWVKRLSRMFKRRDVEELFERLDFEKQNHLSVKVFVREMSMVLNLNLRKRDLYTMFVRLSGEALITKNSFVKELSQE